MDKTLPVDETWRALPETKKFGIAVENILDKIEEFKAAECKLFG